MRRSGALLALMCALGTAACGGDGGGADAQRIPASVEHLCESGPLSTRTGLPAGFPKPSGVTYVEAVKAGPTNVVDGRFDGNVDEAYDTYHDAVEEAGYEILFDEQEQKDAEISYAGEGRSGQIALREECGDEAPVTVHITNRPGG